MQRMSRTVARIAAVAIVAVGGGALTAVPPAMADIGADVRLTCSGKSGTHEVRLRVDSNVPSTATVGQPVQLGTIKVDVTVPAELVKGVLATAPGGAPAPPVTGAPSTDAPSPAIGGVAEMQVALRQPGGDGRGGWPAFALAATSARDGGNVHLTGSGVAPPVVPQAPGGLSWTTHGLDLSLVPEDVATGAGAAGLALRCAAEKETVLGTVRVGSETRSPTRSALTAPSTQAAAAPEENLCEVLPAPGEDPRYGINNDAALHEIFDNPERPDGLRGVDGEGIPQCVKAVGFVNIKKAGNAVPVAVENLIRAPTTDYKPASVFGPNYRELWGYFINRSYPTPGTVLGFGFMPTRAVAETIQIGASGKDGPITGNLRIRALNNQRYAANVLKDSELRARSYVRIKAGEVEVNGLPIDLGDKCMTSPTLFTGDAFLGNHRTGVASYDFGQTLIVQDLKIPAFSGCGVTEDLSPLLTASVSGSGNYVNAEAGLWCNPVTGQNCVDGVAPPPETWTVNPGGEIVATTKPGKPFVLERKIGTRRNEFRCKSMAMRFDMEARHWQSRYRLAKGSLSAEGCTVTDYNGIVHPIKVTQEGSLWLNVATDKGGGQVALTVNGVVLNGRVDDANCSLRISGGLTERFFGPTVEGPGTISGIYDNATHTLSLAGLTSLIPSPKSTCRFPGFDYGTVFSGQEGDFVFPPGQKITHP
ncbi:hypothetical protein HUT06_35225 [Actinomadura sp. NAK00032]|uniref:hypothetical protein n=1 Tax=Actinomadura sp. NAK00032 TaxID=2742128 RepID=UPI0015907476|nr:hypothetical protein [Actinomadura sp. NAK00032]QKW38625.1 hypothetical protein HUT06_35225 [Actinomadura sp. NAK00032]